MGHSAEDGSIPVLDMSALIARLEAAEAGSRELDCLIHEWRNPECTADMRGTYYGEPTGSYFDPRTLQITGEARQCTTSLDAALALAERLGLDGFHTVYAALMNWKAHDPRGPASQTLPLALCISILRATPNGYEAAGEVSPNLKAKAQGEGG